MLKILLEFFALDKKVAVPGVGTIAVRYDASEDSFGSKTIRPAKADIIFTENEEENAIAGFETFARTRYSKSREEVDQFYKNFTNKLNNEKRLNLDGIGVLEKEDNVIRFRQTFDTADFLPVLNAGKVIRDNAEHTITVGENERTSTQMREALSRQESKKYWWVYVLIVLLVAAAGYFFYQFYFLKR